MRLIPDHGLSFFFLKGLRHRDLADFYANYPNISGRQLNPCLTLSLNIMKGKFAERNQTKAINID